MHQCIFFLQFIFGGVILSPMIFILNINGIKRELSKRRWRYYRFANELQRSQSWVFQLMRKRADCRLSTAARIATVLDMKLDEVIKVENR